MRTLIFDTETTGIADFKNRSDPRKQPFIVQIAAVLFDERRPVGHLSLVTVPDLNGVVQAIPAEAARVHGITADLVARVGVPYKIALPMFHNLLKRADRLVAHNIQFDYIVAHAWYQRQFAPLAPLENIPMVCTMRSSEGVLKLPGKFGGYKWPNLTEAHQHFTGEGFDGAHDAMVDVLACARVLWGLEDGGHELLGMKS